MVHGMTILTVDNDPCKILTTPTSLFILNQESLIQARETIHNLKKALEPLAPAAGLAAPQIGLNEPVFIYSWNRAFKNIQAVINPSFIPLNEAQEHRWEACFSAILCENSCSIAHVPRYTKIQVHFYDEFGQKHCQILENFAARVFQHEYDHLQGLINIHKNRVETKSFSSCREMEIFFASLTHKDESTYYAPPLEFP